MKIKVRRLFHLSSRPGCCFSAGFVMACCFLPIGFVFPQPQKVNVTHADSSHVNITRLSIFGGTVLAGGVAVYFARYEPLWKEYYTSFFFHENLAAQNQDKLLHFYGNVVGNVISTKGLSWAGYDDQDAVLYGAATSLAFYTFMKIEDGHVSYIGFDPVKEVANVLGAGYPVAQYYVPSLYSFTPKFSYVASKNTVLAANQVQPGFLEDNEGQKFWLGITVHDLLPKNFRSYWPPIVGLAVGYTLRGENTPHPYHETIIALDLDLRKLPGDSKFLKTMWEMLNYIHLPMPAVRVSQSAIWYGLYF